MKVFISHSSDDKRFVRTLKADLNENGINTWVDEDELNFGDSLVEKLELSIDDTSHFIVVLSESSINSEWVQRELARVLKSFQKKIIPIKYKKCEIPKELQHMLFADVSDIARIVDGDRLILRDEKYYKFIQKLVKSLTNVETKLTGLDKRLLTEDIKQTNINSISDDHNRYLKLKIKGYLGNTARDKYSEIIERSINLNERSKVRINLNKPVLLPHVFKEIFKEIKIGDNITIKNKSNEKKLGLFAGFRKENDDILILPVSIRNYLNIEKSNKNFDVIVSEAKFEILIL
ncbi:toll/interleukin-1 receptor domain-containing protein [Mucilaginibacter sp.]|uniref:toll/interleukin-1 receptor domain-containing protein n=1 Tax=Mucilaginibacter sp. TaxID=1882438 RepID=UPI0025EFA895|nr:toll/interleukin-1 receptor domain-containing protein [Mucilaginibacter sp.]